MVYHKMFGWIIFLTIGAVQCVPQVKWTFYTQAAYWNEAYLVCFVSGGQLARPSTADDKNAMIYFFDNYWESNTGILTVFMDIGRTLTIDTLQWGDCTNIFDVWQKSSMYSSHDCGGVLPTSNQIVTAKCYDSPRKFLCQTEMSSSCPYDVMLGLPMIFPDHYPSISTEEACQQQCTDLVECRAYMFITSCNLYSHNNPMVFVSGANINTGSNIVHLKNCYLADTVEEELTLTTPRSFSPIPFSCGSLDPVVTVFMVMSNPATWAQAVQACSAINASIAIVDTTATFVVMKELLQNSSLGYHWVGYEEIIGPPDETRWVTGENLYNVTKENPPINGSNACGTTHLWTGEHKLHDCDTTLPYVCQHEMGQCFFVMTPGHSATGFNNHGKKSMSDCQAQCESNRNINGGPGCYAFVTKNPASGLFDKDCLTQDFNTIQESFTTADSWMTQDSAMSLWRFTCITVLFDYQISTVETASTTTTTTASTNTTAIPTNSTPTTITLTSSSSPPASSSQSPPPSTLSSQPSSTPSTPSPPPSPTSSTPSPTSSTPSPPPSTPSPPPSTPSPPPSTPSPPPSTPSPPPSTPSPPPSTPSQSSTSSPPPSTPSPPPSPPPSTPSSPRPTNTAPSSPSPSSSTSPATTATPPTIATTGNTQHPLTAPIPNSAGLCICPCHANMTLLSADDFLDELASLHVPADSTGAAYRKKNSMVDYRQSSQGLGTVACAFLTFVLGIVMFFDVIDIYRFLKA